MFRGHAPWVLAACVLSSCGGDLDEIPLPSAYDDVVTISEAVEGAHGKDIWWPWCVAEDNQLAFFHYTGRWTLLAYDIPCVAPGALHMASAEAGSLWVGAQNRVFHLHADGTFDEHSEAVGLGAEGFVRSFSGGRGVMHGLVAIRDASTDRYRRTVYESDGMELRPLAPLPDALATEEWFRVISMGPGDAWLLADMPRQVDGSTEATLLWHHEGATWRPVQSAQEYAPWWSRRFAPDDIYASLTPQDHSDGQLDFERFDGERWSQEALALPPGPEGSVIPLGTRVELFPTASGDLAMLLSIGDTSTAWVRREGEWVESREIATSTRASCAGMGPCGISVTGELGDGTVVRAHALVSRAPRLRLWRP